MYKSLIRPLLFKFDPERAHYFTSNYLKWIYRLPGVSALIRATYQVEHPALHREVSGLHFKNPVGLAAGLDKDAKLYKELSNMGLGFIEIGTITPKLQSGNPPKRLFRLVEDQAIINRMGLNNEGVAAVVERLKKNTNVLIGGNIGKNKITPNEQVVDDYMACFEALFNYVDYFVVNVSSPNTPNLRILQEKEPLKALLTTLQTANNQKAKQKPILLKIVPDLIDDQLLDIIEIVQQTHIVGVIATNTTITCEHLISANRQETGGFSGKPLKQRSTEVIRFLYEKSGGTFPIIGVGGIFSEEDVLEKLAAGASLIQLYSGFIYEGAGLTKRINKVLINNANC